MKRASKGPTRIAALLAAAVSVLATAGCAPLGYYAHLGKGALALVGQGRRVDRLLGDPRTPGDLRDRLLQARGMLAFADSDLGLPVGAKYRKYVDLGRSYVVWTVVAAPEFSLEPKTWCFPIAGCVGYRGYFTLERAERFAARLRDQGFDVSVGGVRAFSSLGRFGDPLLNTFVFDDDQTLAALLFHELAHGAVYVKGDTAFNESFATAVERAAVRRWLTSAAASATSSSVAVAAVAAYDRELGRLDAIHAAIERTRRRLEALYRDAPAADVGPERRAEFRAASLDLRERKAALFGALRLELAALDPEGRTAFGGWLEREIGNADLALVGFYSERLGSFEALLDALGGDLERFYAASECLGEFDAEERSRRMESRDWGDCIIQLARKSG